MTWTALQRTVAEVTTAKVSGCHAAGGALLTLEVSFRTMEWPWESNGAVSLVPQPMLVQAVTRRGELPLGTATPGLGQVVVPMKHSSTAAVQYTLNLGMAALSELEATRDGGTLELAVTLVAHPILSAQRADVPIYPTSIAHKFKVPPDEWLAILGSVGFSETLLTELQLPTAGPPSTAAGRLRLAHAVAARNNGSYGEAMRHSRIALNELGNAGFGGKAPKDVATFLKDKAGTLSQTERYSALKLALELYLSPAHHANAPEEHYCREDADLALAMTAALLKLAAVRGGPGDESE